LPLRSFVLKGRYQREIHADDRKLVSISDENQGWQVTASTHKISAVNPIPFKSAATCSLWMKLMLEGLAQTVLFHP